MKTMKMSLDNMQGKLSRAEMKNIMAGTIYGCTRSKDGVSDSFSCESQAFMDGWAGFWNSAGWKVECWSKEEKVLVEDFGTYFA